LAIASGDSPMIYFGCSADIRPGLLACCSFSKGVSMLISFFISLAAGVASYHYTDNVLAGLAAVLVVGLLFVWLNASVEVRS